MQTRAPRSERDYKISFNQRHSRAKTHTGVIHVINPAATKTLSYTHIPTILIVHLKRLILEKKIQNHIPFDTALEMEPYMAPGHALTQKMKLIGIISHQGTKDHGNYVAITNRGNEWTSFNDAITAQTTLTHLHQSQAYILIYRKMEHSAGTEN